MNSVLLQNSRGRLLFRCPGCNCCHFAEPRMEGGEEPMWDWNGDMFKPTFTPSIRVRLNDEGKQCHFYVKDGQIQFLDDCWHELKGKTVPMLPEPWSS